MLAQKQPLNGACEKYILGEAIKTNGQDTVLRVPKRNIDDRNFIKSIGSAVIKMQFNFENMPLKERDKNIINNLSEMEKSGSF